MLREKSYQEFIRKQLNEVALLKAIRGNKLEKKTIFSRAYSITCIHGNIGALENFFFWGGGATQLPEKILKTAPFLCKTISTH